MRDLYNVMVNEKKPREIGKSFDRSTVAGSYLHPASLIGHVTKGVILLKINGQVK